jgi:hypothetical protein
MRMTIYRAHEFKRELQLISVGWLGSSEGIRSREGSDTEASEAYRRCSTEVGTLITRSILDIPATYPPDTVLSHHELADALNVPLPALHKAEIPVSYLFGKRNPRYVWREVVQRLRDTSEGGATT